VEKKGKDLPLYINLWFVIVLLLGLYLQHDLATPGYIATNWWPLLRLAGGLFAFLWFCDGLTNGPNRRSHDRHQ
jgi:hypothetical protein